MAATEPTAQTGKRLIAVQHVPMLTDGYVHIIRPCSDRRLSGIY